MPEIVEDGVTGRIVDTVEEAVAVLPEVMAMDRRRVRRRFEARFTAERMARDYVELYARGAALAGPRSARTGSEGRGHPEPAPGGAVPAAARGSSQG